MSIENIPYNLNEVRGDNKDCTLIRIIQLSKFGLQQNVILHFELFLNSFLSCLRYELISKWSFHMVS